MKTCAIMQPTFNPWLGYFDLIDQSNVFVLYDDVQLSRQSWQVRNKIKTVNGALFLSIPYIVKENWRELLICKAATNESFPWRKKHIKSIENAYPKAPFFEEVIQLVYDAYSLKYNSISLFNTHLIKAVANRIGIVSQIINSSDLPKMDGTKDVRLSHICKYLEADRYLSPQGSAEYIEEFTPGGELAKSGTEVYYHNYKHPAYPQLYGEFIPFMGILDLLFNVGFKSSLAVIRSGRSDSIHYSKFKSRVN